MGFFFRVSQDNRENSTVYVIQNAFDEIANDIIMNKSV